MSLKKYETFLKVVELQSLTKAAAVLGYTQSGISHMLGSLEDEFGFILLHRSRSGVKLTSEGERVLPMVKMILNANGRLLQTVDAMNGMNTGVVRIGCTTTVAASILPPIVKAYHKKAQEVEFQINTGDQLDIIRWIEEGEVDLGVFPEPVPKNDCIVEPLFEDAMLAVLPESHPQADSKGAFSVQELSKNRLIVSDVGAEDLRNRLKTVRVKMDERCQVKNNTAILALVECGMGISVLPELMFYNRNYNVVTMPLDPPVKRLIDLVWQGAEYVGPAARGFTDFLKQWIRENCENALLKDE